MSLIKDQVLQKQAITNLPDKLQAIDRLNRISIMLNQGLAWLAACSLLLMVLVVVGNALMRIVSAPFAGTTEIVGWLAAITTAFGLGYTQVKKGYVEIDALVERFPPSLHRTIKCIMLLISTIFFAIVSWQIILYGFNVAENGNLSETMRLPFYPLIFLLSIGFAGLTLSLFVDFLKELNGSALK